MPAAWGSLWNRSACCRIYSRFFSSVLKHNETWCSKLNHTVQCSHGKRAVVLYLTRYNYTALLVQTTRGWGVEKLLAFHDVRKRRCLQYTDKLKHKVISVQKPIKCHIRPELNQKKFLQYWNIIIRSRTIHKIWFLTWSKPQSNYLLVLILAVFNVLRIKRNRKHGG